jgi:hypothetical protein
MNKSHLAAHHNVTEFATKIAVNSITPKVRAELELRALLFAGVWKGQREKSLITLAQGLLRRPLGRLARHYRRSHLVPPRHRLGLHLRPGQ